MIPWLRPGDSFPALEKALREPDGLLAAGGDLSVQSLVAAYRRGIFPWFGEGDPILWWSPDPRMVLFPAELHVTRSLRKTLRKGHYTVTADRAFDKVITACRAPREAQDGTWITDQMATAYTRLHLAGYAHSIETWIDDQLAGGLYGVAIGRAFFGESMFTRVSDASKIALIALTLQLRQWNFGLIDCQMRTQHLTSFGAREISRNEFAQRLSELVDYDPIGTRWNMSQELGKGLFRQDLLDDTEAGKNVDV